MTEGRRWRHFPEQHTRAEVEPAAAEHAVRGEDLYVAAGQPYLQRMSLGGAGRRREVVGPACVAHPVRLNLAHAVD